MAGKNDNFDALMAMMALKHIMDDTKDIEIHPFTCEVVVTPTSISCSSSGNKAFLEDIDGGMEWAEETNNPCGCLTYTKSFFLLIQKVAIYVKSPLGFTLSLYGISNRQFLPFHKFTERNHIHLQLFCCIFWCYSLTVHCFLPHFVRFAVP